jgi:protocatechuate 3,4-dioxygenase beta subunit
MAIRWLASVAGCAVLLAGFAPAARACSCISPGPACQAAWNAAGVFIGQVLEVDALPAPTRGLLGDFPVPARRARIRVIERFRGDVPSTLDVITAADGGACGYNFVAGETYLVYVGKSAEGRYTTGRCSKTTLLTDVPAADLAYLRFVNVVPSALGVIRGTALRTDRAYDTARTTPTPHAGVRIVIEGNGLRREAITGADGRYQFAVPPGQYAIRAEVAEGLFTNPSGTVHIKDTRACAEVDLAVQSDGRITGRVVNARGEPLPHISVELLYREWTGRYSRADAPTATDANGVFEFVRVPPGSFVIATDTFAPARDRQRVFLPGVLTVVDAHTVHLAPGQRANVGDITVPDITPQPPPQP